MPTEPNWKSQQRRQYTRKLLVHYLTLHKDLSYDCYTEIEGIVDSIFDEIDDANARAIALGQRVVALEAVIRQMQENR